MFCKTGKSPRWHTCLYELWIYLWLPHYYCWRIAYCCEVSTLMTSLLILITAWLLKIII